MRKPPPLSPRLLAIARQVPPGSYLADIGTDHAHLPLWLLSRGKISRAAASDLRPAPLARGRATAEACGLAQHIDFSLSGGLAALSPGQAQVIVIAGMGGETIARILAEAPWLKTDPALLLLQPMSVAEKLRLFLQTSGFVIEREEIIREEDRLYPLLSVRAGAMPPLTPGECWAGSQRLCAMAGHRRDYLQYLIDKRRRVLHALAHSRVSPALYTQAESLLQELITMEQEWSTWQTSP